MTDTAPCPITPAERQRIYAISEVLRRARSARSENRPLSNGICVSFCHDAVEHTLHLVLDKCGMASTKKSEFLQLVDIAAESYTDRTGENLALRGGLKALNGSRVNFKHHGALPSREASVEAVEVSQAFTSKLLEVFFNIDVTEFDMADALRPSPIREKLLLARTNLKQGEIAESSINCGEALWHFERALSHIFGVGYIPTTHLQTGNREVDQQARPIIERLIRQLLESDVGTLTYSLLGSAGIDIIQHTRFKQALPNISYTGSGQRYVSWTSSSPPTNPSTVHELISHMSNLAHWMGDRFPTLQYEDGAWRY